MQKDLKIIKAKYGEKFSHLCRTLFPTLLETEGLLPSLLESSFCPSHFLYYDITFNLFEIEFQNFINSLLKDDASEDVYTTKTPKELLSEVGYELYECKTESDIQMFKKYYKKEEELCTFKGGRLKSNYVFFAVKKNVDDIRRKNFTNPKRQDEYGTSVISIQFTKGEFNYVSIKNRYNHTVDNADSTFSNNLNNIISGLTRSFEEQYNLKICNEVTDDFEMPGYVLANDGKFYKYNYEINNIYYCPDNIIIENFQPKKFEKERYIIFDYFILDMKEKIISLYDKTIEDSFIVGLNDISKIQIKKDQDGKYICLDIMNQSVIIMLDKENRIICYKNNNIIELEDDFLYYNNKLKILNLENLKKIGDKFLFLNECLHLISIPNVEEIGDDFLYCNLALRKISMPKLIEVGNNFLVDNKNLNDIYFPMLTKVGNNYLYDNLGLTYLELPYLIVVGNSFLRNNISISDIFMPNLEVIGDEFLYSNSNLKKISLPKVKIVGNQFMRYNRSLEGLELPMLKSIESFYLEYNDVLINIVVPEEIRNKFIYNAPFKVNFKNKQKKLKRMYKKGK